MSNNLYLQSVLGEGSLSHVLRFRAWTFGDDAQPPPLVAPRRRRRRAGARPPPPGAQQQVLLDVARAFHWDACRGWTLTERGARLHALTRVLDRVFPAALQRVFPFYVQGAHDVAGVLLLGLGEAGASLALARLVKSSLGGLLQQDMAVPCALLRLIPRLLRAAEDTRTGALLAAVSVATPLPPFALPWLLTWFAHPLSRFSVVARLFDAFTMSHPLLPLYLSAALVAAPASYDALLAVTTAHAGDEGELFRALSGLPEATLTDTRSADAALRAAAALYARCPPCELLRGERGKVDAEAAEDLQLLRDRWPELWTWTPPCGGDKKRKSGGVPRDALIDACAPVRGHSNDTRWVCGAFLAAVVAVLVTVAASWYGHGLK